MPLSEIPIGIAPIFHRPSTTEPAPDTRADQAHLRETENESPAPIPAPAPASDAAAAAAAPSAPASAGGQDEPATSAPVVPPPPAPAPEPTWEELIAAAEKRSAAPAPEPAPVAQDAIAAAEDFSNLDFSEPKLGPAPPRREVPREANGAPVPQSAVPLHVSAAERAIWRHGCNWLELFRLCRRSRCRHAGQCRGEPTACLRAGVQHAPDSVRQFVIGMIKGQELGLSFDEAFEDAADYQDAYFAWVAGLEAAQRR